MRKHSNLEGRRIAILAADGFEKIELTAPLKALRRAGADVDIISLRSGRIRGVNLHEPAGRIRVTATVDEVSPDDYDGLFVPGGLINPDLLRQSAEAREFVSGFDAADKPIATICHGPWVLISAGMAEGRTLTSWPGIRDDVVNAGATWVDEELVRDGNLLSSRGPQDLKPFIEGLLELFSADALLDVEDQPLRSTSDPQHDEPPAVMLKAMKWMPRPSFRTAIGLGAAALGVALVARKRARQRQELVIIEHQEITAVPPNAYRQFDTPMPDPGF